MVYIYILQCQNGKYYIGKTEDPDTRILDHLDGKAAAWTKKYPPIDVIKVIPDCDDFDEDKYTKQYMAKFGIDNVRGGSYVQVTLDSQTKKFIQREITMTSNRCYKCGLDNHYGRYCSSRVYKNEVTKDVYVSDQKNSSLREELNEVTKDVFVGDQINSSLREELNEVTKDVYVSDQKNSSLREELNEVTKDANLKSTHCSKLVKELNKYLDDEEITDIENMDLFEGHLLTMFKIAKNVSGMNSLMLRQLGKAVKNWSDKTLRKFQNLPNNNDFVVKAESFLKLCIEELHVSIENENHEKIIDTFEKLHKLDSWTMAIRDQINGNLFHTLIVFNGQHPLLQIIVKN